MKKITYLIFTCIIFIFLFSNLYSLAQEQFHTGLKSLSKEDYAKFPADESKFKGEVKKYVDLSVDMPPPGNQDSSNSCVAC